MATESSAEGPAAPVGGAGVTIPGYQPVELLGNAPSFGAWVRAIQVRMDRHVLLKVLKPGLPVARDHFAREIQAFVGLDGDGVLRAIDEGTVSGYRYLVVDEAEGILLTASAIGGTEGWRGLARTMLGLRRRLLERGLVLLPAPAAAWRRLPSGDFALADLGWLVPLGDPIPNHPSMPRDRIGQPATPADAVHSFLRAGPAVALGVGASMPAVWRRAAAMLEVVPEDADVETVDLLLGDAESSLAGHGSGRPIAIGVFALALVVAAVWVTATLFQRGDGGGENGDTPIEGGPGPDGTTDPRTAGTGPDSGDGEKRSEDPAAVALREAESRAFAALLEAMPAEARPEGETLPLPLPAPVRTALSEVVARFPDARAARVAAHELGADSLERRLLLEEEWARTAPAVAEEFSAGHLASAALLLEPFRRRYAEWGGPELAPELDAPARSLRERIVREGATARAGLEETVRTARAERRYRKAAIELGRALSGLLPDDRRWAERTRIELIETAERYETTAAALEAGLDAAVEAASRGAWDAAPTALEPLPGEEEFPELSGRREEWFGWVSQACALANRIGTELDHRAAGTRARSYQLVDGTRVRGRVVETRPTDFTLKLEGLVTTRDLRWLDLDSEQWIELSGGTPPAALRLLARSLLGDEDAITEAAKLEPVPGWVAEAELRSRRAANVDLEQWRERGRTAYAAGDASAAREAARTIARTVPDALWAPLRAELEEWCGAHWTVVGPVDAFRGATGSWDPAGRITLRFDFASEGASDVWIPSRAGQGRRRSAGRAMAVTGSIWLAPDGDPDIFAEELAVRAVLSTATKEAPNLNLVLFSHDDGETRRGELFGLGFRPPSVGRIDGDPAIFLPANVCGPLAAAERGKGRSLSWVSVEPRVSPSDRVVLEIARRKDVRSFVWEGRFDRSFPVEGESPPGGTVEIRSHRSELLVGEIEIEGRLGDRWWQDWLSERVETDLRP